MERRTVTVLFADLAGVTSLSEALDAKDVAAVQEAYVAVVRDAVARHGGRLETSIGDAAVAAFGADRTREDDAERAVRCGLAIVALVDALAARLGLDDAAIAVRVGIATGEVAMATEGPDAGRLTGDTMNTAARLQAAASPGAVLCGRSTALAAAHAVAFGSLEPVALEGKAEPVPAAVALGIRPEVSRAAAMGGIHGGFTGRDAELRTLVGALDGTAGGRSARWTVLAPPGVGKSRLLDEVRRAAQGLERPVAVWAVRARADQVAPFAAVAGLVRDALGSDDAGARLTGAGVPPERAAVLAAEARTLLAGGTATGAAADATDATMGAAADLAGTAADLADARAARFRAWLEILDSLAGRRTQLWLVEDVHWAGGDLLAFLALAGTAPAAPSGRLVLATARPMLLEAWPDWPEAEGGQRLDLEPLSPGSAVDLVRALVGDALPGDLQRAVATRGDGNPLFIEELLRSWVSLGVLVRDGARWSLAVEPAEVPIPETVQALYAAQLDDLPAAAREVARRASIAGRRFPRGLLAELGLPGEGPTAGLALLLRGTLVDGPRDDVAVGPAYAFRHALLRDAGYASLARADRARLHLVAARWLASLPGAREALAEPIGRQFAAAAAATSTLTVPDRGAPDRGAPGSAVLREEAAAWLTIAAERALALAAHDAAASLLRESIALSDPGASLAIATRIARLGEVLGPSAGVDAARGRLDDARARLAALLGGPQGAAAREGYARASVAAVRLLLGSLRYRDGAALAGEALAVLGCPDDRGVARLELARATAELHASNDAGPARAVAERILARARAAGDRALELEALRLRIAAESEVGTADHGLTELAAALAAGLGDWSTAVGMRIKAAMSRVGARTAEVPALLDEADRLARAHGMLQSQATIGMCRAECAFHLGDWDEAIRRGREGLAIAMPAGDQRAALRTWFVLGPIAARRGDLVLLTQLRDWMRGMTDLPDSPYGRLMRAAVDLDIGALRESGSPLPDPDRLVDAWALPCDDASFLAARDAVLRAWWWAGRFDEVAATLDRIPLDEGSSPMARGTVTLWRARLASDEASAVALAREALEAVRQWGAAWWIAQSIALLDDAGAATLDERRERLEIEGRLMGRAP
jgi:class 3 adenylate cyclase